MLALTSEVFESIRVSRFMARSIDDEGHSSFYIDFCLGFLNSVIILLRFVN
jgi:hypothetical protein